MNHYFITGASHGIGKALAELLLKDPENLVTGISRSNTISHKNYRHVELDLSSPHRIDEFIFKKTGNYKKVVLVNNAGIISQIMRMGSLEPDKIIAEYNVNLVAPAILTNAFIRAFEKEACEKIILNISSGAGKNPVDAWSIYCSSKAGLDMFSRVVHEEQKVRDTGFKIFAVSPGVVDTAMQEFIRQSDVDNFSRKADFEEYKNAGQLADSNFVAEKLLRILANTNSIQEPILTVKDF